MYHLAVSSVGLNSHVVAVNTPSAVYLCYLLHATEIVGGARLAHGFHWRCSRLRQLVVVLLSWLSGMGGKFLQTSGHEMEKKTPHELRLQHVHSPENKYPAPLSSPTTAAWVNHTYATIY